MKKGDLILDDSTELPVNLSNIFLVFVATLLITSIFGTRCPLGLGDPSEAESLCHVRNAEHLIVHVKELNIVLHVSRLNNLLKFSISPGKILSSFFVFTGYF